MSDTIDLTPAPPLAVFSGDRREVMRITLDGQLVAGPGLSQDEATRECFRSLTDYFKFEWDTRAALEKRVAALEIENGELTAKNKEHEANWAMLRRLP